ncbi:MAG: hypothetical protein N2111_14245 [Candidatus Sumerlaeaceae bacterium]|nr:hypothetical protein [Candidatus Sumerlaeaceae bacterium]
MAAALQGCLNFGGGIKSHAAWYSRSLGTLGCSAVSVVTLSRSLGSFGCWAIWVARHSGRLGSLGGVVASPGTSHGAAQSGRLRTLGGIAVWAAGRSGSLGGLGGYKT